MSMSNPSQPPTDTVVPHAASEFEPVPAQPHLHPTGSTDSHAEASSASTDSDTTSSQSQSDSFVAPLQPQSYYTSSSLHHHHLHQQQPQQGPPRPRHFASAPAPILGFHRHHHAHHAIASEALAPPEPIATAAVTPSLELGNRWSHHPPPASPLSPITFSHHQPLSPAGMSVAATQAAASSPSIELGQQHARSATFMSPLSVSRTRSWIVPRRQLSHGAFAAAPLSPLVTTTQPQSPQQQHTRRRTTSSSAAAAAARVGSSSPEPESEEDDNVDQAPRPSETLASSPSSPSSYCSISPLVSSLALSAASQLLGPVSHVLESLSTLAQSPSDADADVAANASLALSQDLVAAATSSIRTWLMRAMYMALLVLDDAGSATSCRALARIAHGGAGADTELDEPPTLTAFDLCELMVVLVDLVHIYATTHHSISLTLLCTAPATTVHGDESNLRQLVLAVLFTLLNACPPRSSISIAVHACHMSCATHSPPIITQRGSASPVALSMQVKLPVSGSTHEIEIDWSSVESALRRLGRPDLETVVVVDGHVALVVEFGLPVSRVQVQPLPAAHAHEPLAATPVVPEPPAHAGHPNADAMAGGLQAPIPMPPVPTSSTETCGAAAGAAPMATATAAMLPDATALLIHELFQWLVQPVSVVDPHPVLGLVAQTRSPVVPVGVLDNGRGAWELAWGPVPVALASGVHDLEAQGMERCRLIVVEDGLQEGLVRWLVAKRTQQPAGMRSSMGVLVTCATIEDAKRAVHDLAAVQLVTGEGHSLLELAANVGVVVHVMAAKAAAVPQDQLDQQIAAAEELAVPTSKAMYHLLALYQATATSDEMTLIAGTGMASNEEDDDEELEEHSDEVIQATEPTEEFVPLVAPPTLLAPPVSAHFLSSAATAMALGNVAVSPMLCSTSGSFKAGFTKGAPSLTCSPRTSNSDPRLTLAPMEQLPMHRPPPSPASPNPPRFLTRRKTTHGGGSTMRGHPMPPTTPTAATFPRPPPSTPHAQEMPKPPTASHPHTSLASVADQPSDFPVITTHVRVLIVEDNPINLRILSAFLTKRNIQWAAAKDGAEAVRTFASCPPGTGLEFHLVLMDLQLPVMDGLEATRRIRQVEDAWPPAALMAQAQQQQLRSVTPELLVDEGGLLHSVCAQTGTEADNDKQDKPEQEAHETKLDVIDGVLVGPSIESLVDRVNKKRAALGQHQWMDQRTPYPHDSPSKHSSATSTAGRPSLTRQHSTSAESAIHPLAIAQKSALVAGDPLIASNTFGVDLLPSTEICVPTLAGHSILTSGGGGGNSAGTRSRVSSDPLATASGNTSGFAGGRGLLLTGPESRYVPGMQPPMPVVVGGGGMSAAEQDRGVSLARRRSLHVLPAADEGAARSRSESAEDQSRQMRRQQSTMDTMTHLTTPHLPSTSRASGSGSSGSSHSSSSSFNTVKSTPQSSTATATHLPPSVAPAVGVPSAHQAIAPYHADLAPSFRSIVVALTASNSSDDRKAAMAAGCNDFISKPINLRWLQAKIMEWGSIQALIRCFGDDGHAVGGEAQKVASGVQEGPVMVNVPGTGAAGRTSTKGGGTLAGGNLGPGPGLTP